MKGHLVWTHGREVKGSILAAELSITEITVVDAQLRVPLNICSRQASWSIHPNIVGTVGED